MKRTIQVIRILVRIIGVTQLILGGLFWTGNALALIPIHMLVGLLLTLTLWVLSFLAARAGVNLGLVLLAVLWGVLLPVFGMTQMEMLPGDAHWVIQVLHLLMGIAGLGLAERLASAIMPPEGSREPAAQPVG
jgi:hypothetical protein